MKTSLHKLVTLFLVLLLAVLLVACTPTAEEGQESEITPPAQNDDDQGDDDDGENEEATIEFSGDITSINGTVIVVNGLNVETASATLTGLLNVGATVQVQGILQPNAVITALVIIVIVETTPEATVPAEGTAEATQPAPESTPIVDDDAIIIVIEGPVEAINVNIITIYGINIILAADDPLLTVIQIGDVIRIEGAMDDDSDGVTIVIIAITIIFIDVDVFVLDGDVWRDDGGCQNGPPPWAPANGWRRRCESGGGGNGGGSGGGRGGSGRGRGGSS